MTESTEALASTAPRIGRPRRGLTPRTRETAWGFVFIGPWLIGLVLFTAGPMIASLVLSLTDFDLIHPDAVRFIGLDNYARMVTDPNVVTSVLVTFKFAAIVVPLTMLASLGFAVLLNSPHLFGRNILRTLVYMPIQIPLVASTLVWIGFLNTNTGWMNAILTFLGIPGPDWINSTTWIYPALSLIGLWGIGNFMLINIAGLQSVPTEMYEAARIDGAGPWTLFRRITIPLMSPVLLYNLVISLIVTFQYFTQAYTLTNGRGDPDNATLFINLDLFREAFTFNRMGYGAAIAWLLFALVLLLTIALFVFARRRVYYAGTDR
ncbi:MAG: multiple sugar transport system permease protein [Chloroflexota bacterium]|jgi:multiple sugar transport system permease protein|nr:multiple sugar transport system permease protein [Chloroflexota bacterium]